MKLIILCIYFLCSLFILLMIRQDRIYCQILSSNLLHLMMKTNYSGHDNVHQKIKNVSRNITGSKAKVVWNTIQETQANIAVFKERLKREIFLNASKCKVLGNCSGGHEGMRVAGSKNLELRRSEPLCLTSRGLKPY